jgi:hypothetical protein
LASGRSHGSLPLRRSSAWRSTRRCEHQTLVARALLQIEALAFVDALGDVGRLLAVGDQHGAGGGVEADVGIGIADAADGLARDGVVAHARVGGDLAGEHHQVVLDQRLGRDARVLVLL